MTQLMTQLMTQSMPKQMKRLRPLLWIARTLSQKLTKILNMSQLLLNQPIVLIQAIPKTKQQKYVPQIATSVILYGNTIQLIQ
jgi:hypothetical protein